MSIAVLPLANASGDPDKEYFADGLTDYLHNALTGVRTLRVASRGAAAALQDHSRCRSWVVSLASHG